MRRHPNVRDVNLQWHERTKALRLMVDQDRARALGLNTQEISRTLQTLLSGAIVTQVREGTELIDVVARAVETERLDAQKLGELTIRTAHGRSVPLSQVAIIEPVIEEGGLWVRNRLPSLSVRADVQGAQAPDVSRQIESMLQDIRDGLPVGYRIDTGGTIEESVKADASIQAVMPVMLLLWATFLMIQLQSFSRMFMVVLTAPLGMIGVSLALLLTQVPFGFIATLGVIALAGMIMRNSVILVDQIDRNIAVGEPRWQAIMWGVLMSVVAVVLMREGGLGNLQTMTLIVALPFAMLMLLMCFSLWKGLNADRQYFSTKVHPSSVFWSGKNWHVRLEQMMNQTQEDDILRFLKHTALPAMRELRQELTSKYGLTVQVNSLFDQPEPAVELVIQKESLRDFMYGIKSVKREVSEQLINDEHLPHIQHSVTYEPYTYFFDGRTGYDVQYMDHNELIADMLKQYERYLSLLGGVGQELMSHEQTDLAE